MDKLAELKEKLKELSPTELEELKSYLKTDEGAEEAEDPKVEAETPKAEEKPEGSESAADETADATPEAEASQETTEEKPAEAAEETKAEEVPTEAETSENEANVSAVQAPVETSQEDDIPIMQKGVVTSEDDTVDEGAITAETGEKLPVDYEQIVEGLNAKIAALEAENASLKNKVEGAFGYSAKPTTPAKVNRLYDECEDVHFHK